METPRWLKRGLAGIIGSAGLAYPVCAAICPRGRGYCPYPGSCFLYTDVDANTICDYTPRSVTSAPTAASPTPAASPVFEGTSSSLTVPATPSLSPAATVSSNASVPFIPDTGLFLPDGLIMGAVFTIVLLVLFFFLFRSGIPGTRLQKPVPALGTSALFALGIGEIVTYLLLGEETLASAFAVVYLLAGTLLAAFVWKSGAMSRKIAVATVMMSTVFGFVILAPLMPMEFPGIVSIVTSGQTVAPGIIGILAGIGLVLLVGRTFCGHLCPVGSVQELVWNLPGKKIDIRKTHYLEVLRAGVFVVTVIGALWYVNLMEYTGVYDFFSLTLSIGLVVFLVLLLLSVFMYRPVCRGICPFGLLFSIPAHFSLYRLRRTNACIRCRKCEKACPAHVAGRDSSKRECYLCARCTAACPVPGALVYERKA
ncbi:MAG: quinol dehydrogenase membrane component [Euryarchaeota archaeon ADurb.BinA087]|nr:MAG: quinol dehydrogenase membrane component [Euryarchaeota archaeon ADurb.BinA087]